MSRISIADTDSFTSLPRLPRDEGGPVFAEPWQAQAFALAVKLSEQGHFTWKEWAAALAEELQSAAKRGEPDDGSRYYEHWLAALEKLVAAKGLVDSTALVTRKEAWATAYRNTPHGQPIELRQSPGATDAGWLLVGVACAAALYWMLQHLSPGLSSERIILTGTHPGGDGAVIAPVGLAVSASLGAVLGMQHALEPDHLAAVATLMTGERSSAKAAWLGACWGLGHTLTLLIAGALLVALRAEVPAMAALLFESGVVALLVGFGVRALYQGARGVTPRRTHSHAKRGGLSSYADRWTIARPLLVGAVHGLAGSGALTALVMTTLPSTMTRLGYMTLFGLGSTAAMAVLSGFLGWAIARLGANRTVARTLSIAAGSFSIALGFFWGYPLVAALF